MALPLPSKTSLTPSAARRFWLPPVLFSYRKRRVATLVFTGRCTLWLCGYRCRADTRVVHSPDYFYDLELDFVLFDALEEVDVAKGTGALLAMDIPFEVPDVDKTAVEADSHTVDVEVEVDEDEDDGCDNDDGDNMDYSMFFLCSIWIYCLWGTIPFIGKLVYKLPLVKGIVADIRNDLKNLPFLLFQLAYVCAGTYLLEQAAMGVFFFDPLARIGWLMERGRIDTTFLAQELAVLYLWAWWKTVVPAERTLAQLKMGLALEDWVRCDTEDRGIISVEGSLTRRVLETLDEPSEFMVSNPPDG